MRPAWGPDALGGGQRNPGAEGWAALGCARAPRPGLPPPGWRTRAPQTKTPRGDLDLVRVPPPPQAFLPCVHLLFTQAPIPRSCGLVEGGWGALPAALPRAPAT